MDVIRPVFTAADLIQLPDDGKRYEILEGDLAVSLSPNRKHQRAVLRLTRFLQTMEEAGYGEVYPALFDVILDEYNVVDPDVLFMRTDRLTIVTDANVQGPPDLLVEVLSPSTRARDLGVKVHLYARFGVPEYWVVDPDKANLTIHRLTDGGYQVDGPFHGGDQVRTPLFPEAFLTVADVFQD